MVFHPWERPFIRSHGLRGFIPISGILKCGKRTQQHKIYKNDCWWASIVSSFQNCIPFFRGCPQAMAGAAYHGWTDLGFWLHEWMHDYDPSSVLPCYPPLIPQLGSTLKVSQDKTKVLVKLDSYPEALGEKIIFKSHSGYW